jgi:membrane-bound serine protease (ClpP class)
MSRNLILLTTILLSFQAGTGISGQEGQILVYKFDIKKEIAAPVWRTTQKSFDEAASLGADYILIHMNTYGGQVNFADSIRTRLINSEIPVLVFVDNQAISAGALIAIAADSILYASRRFNRCCHSCGPDRTAGT